ncbi:MAG: phosphoribosylaminoimidazolesuccinocarboxamide synthase [Acidimicrobiales bacterium]
MIGTGGSTLELVHSGKVRDVYDAGGGLLLMVASDRVSAFDVVMAEPVPGKGEVLTGMTSFWLGKLSGLARSHLVSVDPADFPARTAELNAGAGAGAYAGGLAGRAMLVRRAEMLPVECIVRGYLAGSAWREYAERGTIHSMPAPAGLEESSRLPEPIFTPSTKAASGHDVNLSLEEAAELVGPGMLSRAREISLAAYALARELAAERGIVIADTKFELGLIDGELAICDEVLTPDSSRFWPVAEVKEGTTPPSFDKQPLRDWLEASGWDKAPPPPPLPDEVVRSMSLRYAEAYRLICGDRLASGGRLVGDAR